MAKILLYHHVQGLTPGIHAFAEKLRGAGHAVTTPDLFDGHTFDSIDDGVAYVRGSGGFGAVLERGVAAAETLPSDLVYAGFSMGVMPAQQLSQTRAGARGALFFHACLPVEEFSPTWPAGVPVQIHGMDHDPFFADEGDIDAARALVASTDGAELFVYPGDQHLFTDESLPAYDAGATDLLMQRVLAFLEALDS